MTHTQEASTLSLALALEGPLMTFGHGSHERKKPTTPYPTKSSIIGLIAAALGMKRDDDLTELRTLKFAVRIDQAGVIGTSFQTASDVLLVNGTVNSKKQIIEREYLQDAAFTCAVQGESTLIRRIQEALKNPRWPLYIGTRVCLPTRPIHVEDARDESLEDLLSRLPLLGNEQGTEVECMIEDVFGTLTLRDNPPVSGFGTMHGKKRHRRQVNVIRIKKTTKEQHVPA